jgi:hypothetical protein
VAANAPLQMDPQVAAKALEKSLGGAGRKDRIDLTIADAAAKSGLALRDAERGMHALLSEYRGHLRVTSEGELLFRFPSGLTKPWETRTKLEALASRAGRALVGVGRFVVRAWIAVVLIGYAALFLALIIGLTLARSSDSKSDRGGGMGLELGAVLFRIIGEALFWTFHPFSPFAVGYYGYGYNEPRYAPARQRRSDENKEPFYNKVNRFFFGPDLPAEDPRAMEKTILAEIRGQKGRIGLADVMRVTGLPRDEADPLMSRLMLDYDGSVEVSDEGGIFYRFESMRKTVAQPGTDVRPAPAWARLEKLAPLTGNEAGTNLLIVALNGFNMIMSLYALANGMTFERIAMLLRGVRVDALHPLPDTGTAIALGVVPLVFSIALFALPVLRALYRPIKEKRVARANGRRGLLREVLTGIDKREITDASLQNAWKSAAGVAPDSKEITREVVALGGDVEIQDDGRVRYRFPDLEAEAAALKAEREAASEEEARVGKIVFSSEN